MLSVYFHTLCLLFPLLFPRICIIALLWILPLSSHSSCSGSLSHHPTLFPPFTRLLFITFQILCPRDECISQDQGVFFFLMGFCFCFYFLSPYQSLVCNLLNKKHESSCKHHERAVVLSVWARSVSLSSPSNLPLYLTCLWFCEFPRQTAILKALSIKST